MEQKANQHMTIEATVIRANGKREKLGTIVGGNVFQKVASFIRIKLTNVKHYFVNRTH